MMEKMYSCPWHGGEILAGDYCTECLQEFKVLPAPDDMTPEQRRDEMLKWDNALTVPFRDVLWPRLNALVGREVYLGEFSFNWDGLVDEAMGAERHPTIDEIDEAHRRAAPPGSKVFRLDAD